MKGAARKHNLVLHEANLWNNSTNEKNGIMDIQQNEGTSYYPDHIKC